MGASSPVGSDRVFSRQGFPDDGSGIILSCWSLKRGAYRGKVLAVKIMVLTTSGRLVESIRYGLIREILSSYFSPVAKAGWSDL